MSNETTQYTPADVRERIKAAIRDGVRYVAKADGAYLYEPSVDETADRILSLLRTPRGEEEAQPWRKVGEEPPPNGVQVLAYDPRPDGYSYTGCWAYTLIRKGDQFYLDGERCDEEDRSRLQIEEWLWQPLPPYPGSRSKDDDVRDAALRSDARGEDDVGEVCHLCGEDFDPRESGTVIGPLGQDDGVPRWYRCPRCARAYDAGYQQGQRDPRGDETADPTALRDGAQGEDFNPLTDPLPESEFQRVERVFSAAARRRGKEA